LLNKYSSSQKRLYTRENIPEHVADCVVEIPDITLVEFAILRRVLVVIDPEIFVIYEQVHGVVFITPLSLIDQINHMRQYGNSESLKYDMNYFWILSDYFSRCVTFQI
jgi:hypothetical protein